MTWGGEGVKDRHILDPGVRECPGGLLPGRVQDVSVSFSPSSQHWQCLAHSRCLPSQRLCSCVGKTPERVSWVVGGTRDVGTQQGGTHLGAPVTVEPGRGAGPHVTGLSAGGPRGPRGAFLLTHFIPVVADTADLPAPLAAPASHRALRGRGALRPGLPWLPHRLPSLGLLNQDGPLTPGSEVTGLRGLRSRLSTGHVLAALQLEAHMRSHL